MKFSIFSIYSIFFIYLFSQMDNRRKKKSSSLLFVYILFFIFHFIFPIDVFIDEKTNIGDIFILRGLI